MAAQTDKLMMSCAIWPRIPNKHGRRVAQCSGQARIHGVRRWMPLWLGVCATQSSDSKWVALLGAYACMSPKWTRWSKWICGVSTSLLCASLLYASVTSLRVMARPGVLVRLFARSWPYFPLHCWRGPRGHDENVDFTPATSQSRANS